MRTYMRVQTWLVAAPPTVAPEFVEEGAIGPAEEGGGGGMGSYASLVFCR